MPLSLITDIDEVNNYKFHIYPSPSRDIITVEVGVIDESSFIKIYNTTGKLLKTLKVQENKTKIDVSPLPPGIYIVKYNGQNIDLKASFIKE